jgi:alanine-synthesizing transaminase
LPDIDRLRIVTLWRADDIEEAIGRLGEFLATRRG